MSRNIPAPTVARFDHARGFTLIELLVTIAISAILLTVAAPSYQVAMRTNRVASVTNELVTSLQLARSEAISRRTRVSLCKSANAAAASPTCSASANWQDGWLVFVDAGTAGTLDGTDTLLRTSQPN